MHCGIYAITNILNSDMYIGQSVNLEKRKRSHFNSLYNGNHKNPHLQSAYDKYGKDNFIFKILLYCERFELTRYEQGLVDALDPKYNLCKICVNSLAGVTIPEDVRIKISMALKGRIKSAETRKRMSVAFKGIKRSAECNRRNSEHRKGKKLPEETKRKMSQARMGNKYSKGRKLPDWHVQKLIQSHVGKPVWNKGIPHTEEHKRKMSEALKGRKFSEESKQKISKSRKAYFAKKKLKVEEA